MRAHGLAIRVGHEGTVPDVEHFTVHLGDYHCICGKITYRIFADPPHADLGQRYGRHIGQLLEELHKRGEKHPDVIELPMSAEFPT